MAAPAVLDLDGVIGFAGNVMNGVKLLPDRKRMVYPLGSTIVVRDIANNKDLHFLSGHSDNVTCMALSPSGRYLASGQQTFIGFQADVIIWDLDTMELKHRMKLHKVRVQDVCFSCDEEFVASLGGEDDNSLVIWDMENGKAVCGSPASNEPARVVSFLRHDPRKVVTAGKNTMRVWDFDLELRKLRPVACNLGKLQRTIQCMFIDEEDDLCYAGTTTGDVLIVSLRTHLFKHVGPKTRISLGVTCVTRAPNGSILVGAGDGTVGLVHPGTLKVQQSVNLAGGAVTSLAPHSSGQLFFAGMAGCTQWVVRYDGLRADLRSTCHSGRINDVSFPYNYSDVFATAAMGELRVWNSKTLGELLRICVPNMNANCVCFSNDGLAILSGWSDGKIRAFGPQSGKLLYVINDAHLGGVTALACCADPDRLVSGGADGQVRVWRISSQSRVMLASMKEHKATISSVRVRANDSECVSASDDGSCLIWDMTRFHRNSSLFASTFFKAALYHPDESQLITCGTDRKITNWDAYDGSAIRIVDGSTTAEVNSLDIAKDGEFFVSGGGDRLVKLWNYDEGLVRAVGAGHSAPVTKVAIAPNQSFIVSVGDEGAIVLWRVPADASVPSGE